ncbi:MAG: hypothetical protein AAB871_03880 [Patescibacteria group bacterium]
MVILPNKSELELQEKIISWEEKIESVPKALFITLAVVMVLAVPAGVALKYAFYSVFLTGYTPPPIIYVKPDAKDLEIKDQKFFSIGSGLYFAYARVSNPNPDLAIRQLDYDFILTGTAGEELKRYSSSTSTASYILPGQENILLMPPQSLSTPPAGVKVLFRFNHWSRVSEISNLNFIFEGVEYGAEKNGPFMVSAQARNDNPYIVPELELAILLYDIKREVVGVNFTTLNYMMPHESRFFRVLWPVPISGAVAFVEFKPRVNLLKKGSIFTSESEMDDYFDLQRR